MINDNNRIRIIIYEYMFHKSARIENQYHELIDEHYKIINSRWSEKCIHNDELIKLMLMNERYNTFNEIFHEVLDLLSFYDEDLHHVINDDDC